MRRRLEAALTILVAVVVFAAAGYVIVHKDPVKDAGQTPGFTLGPTDPAPTSSTDLQSGAGTPTGTPTSTKPIVVFLGDDWTAADGATSKTKGFVALLSSSLPITARSTSVTGGGYAKSSAAGQTYLSKIDAIAAVKPSMIVVTGGRNDVGDDLNTLRAKAKSLFATLHERLPNAKLVAVAAFWGDSDHPSELDDVDSAIKAGVQAVNGTYLDLADPLHGHPEWMANDTDPNNKGYAALASSLKTALATLLPAT